MAVEDELFEGLVEVFRRLRQMVQQFRGAAGLSRRQQRRVLREAMRDWLKNDPQANAVRQQMDGQTFEQRVAAEVNRILDERFGPENAAEPNLDPQQIEAPEQGEEAATPEAEAQEAATPEAELPGVEPVEVEQSGSVLEQTDGGQVVVPPVIGAEGQQFEAGEVEQSGSVLEQTDDGQVVVPPVIGAEGLQAEGAGQEPGFFEQGDDGQLVSPAVIGEDNPAPAAEQDNPIFNQLMREQAERQALEQDNPIFTQLMSEQAERQGRQRPEGEQAASPAGDDQAATGDAANKQEAQGQAAAAQSPELTPDEWMLRRLHEDGRPSASGAVKRPEGAPAASPHAGATSGAHHQTPSKEGPSRGD